MSSMLEKMLAVMSEDDRIIFEQLSKRLFEAKGDPAQLTQSDLQIIQQMEKKYGHQIDQAHKQSSQSTAQKTQAVVDFLETPFAQHCRQVLARHLGSQFPQEQDAVAHAFESRWIPEEMKNEVFIEELFEKFEPDIYQANQWREDIVPTKTDQKMAVGIAWFSVIYQLFERLKD